MNTWRKKRSPARTLHPLWRGVGCLLVVSIPLLAWWLSAFGVDFVQAEFPQWLRSVRSGSDQMLFVRIGVAIVIGLGLYLLLSFFSALLFSVVDKIDRFIRRSAGDAGAPE